MNALIVVLAILSLTSAVMVWGWITDQMWFRWLLPKVIEKAERNRWSEAVGRKISHKEWLRIKEIMRESSE